MKRKPVDVLELRIGNLVRYSGDVRRVTAVSNGSIFLDGVVGAANPDEVYPIILSQSEINTKNLTPVGYRDYFVLYGDFVLSLPKDNESDRAEVGILIPGTDLFCYEDYIYIKVAAVRYVHRFQNVLMDMNIKVNIGLKPVQ